MKSSKIIGKYQYFRKYKPKYEFRYKQAWKTVSKFTYPKAVILPEIKNALKQEPEIMFNTTRYSEEIKRNTIIGYEDLKNYEPIDISKYVIIENPIYEIERKPAFLFNQYKRFSFGIEQAKLLTKTTVDETSYLNGFDCELPKSCKGTLDRYVLKANWWTPDEDKFPRKYSPEHIKHNFPSEYGILPKNSIRYLLTDLLLYCEYLSNQGSQIFDQDHLIETYYNFDGNRVLLNNKFDMFVSSEKPLPCFENNFRKFDLSSSLKVLEPVHPLIDMDITKYYNLENVDGIKSDMFQDNPLYPHIVTVNLDLPNIYTDFLEPEAQQITQSEKDAIAIMYCFSKCLSTARRLYGNEAVDNCKIKLPKPICLIGICSDGVDMHFVCYQLNSTDFNDFSVSNVAWIDRSNKLYEKKRSIIRPNRFARYENLDLNCFKKFYKYYKYTI